MSFEFELIVELKLALFIIILLSMYIKWQDYEITIRILETNGSAAFRSFALVRDLSPNQNRGE